MSSVPLQEVIQLPGQWPSRHTRALSSHLHKRSELSSSSKGFSCCSLQYLVEIGILQNSTFYKLIWIPTVNDLGGGASLRYYRYLQSPKLSSFWSRQSFQLVPESQLCRVVYESDTLKDVLAKLNDANANNVVVLDSEQVVKGIITTTDMLLFLGLSVGAFKKTLQWAHIKCD